MHHSVLLILIGFSCTNNLWGYGGNYKSISSGSNGWPYLPFGWGGFANKNVRNSYGTGNEDKNYGQNMEAEKCLNANVDLNGGQASGVEACNSQSANEYLMRNENACAWSGSDYFRRGNANALGNNNMNNVGWGGLFTNNCY